MSRILFVMLHPGFVRYYEGALRALAEAGHDVHVAFEVNRTKLGEDETARRLTGWSPRITVGATPERVASVREFLARADRTASRGGGFVAPARGAHARTEAWESLATTVRLLVDYLRFFEPEFQGAEALRDRAEKRLPRVYVSGVRRIARAGPVPRRLLARVLAWIEAAIPTGDALDAFLHEHRPDLLLVTPLIELGSQQVDYVKAARRAGIRSALCVASWDNLTSKGLIRVLPDHVIVWNEAQRQEAVSLHGVPADRVLVTGAQLFDPWFVTEPSRTREEFCRMVGLDPARPFLLYVGSSIFIAPDEVPFAERWLATLRASVDEAVAGAGVLLRPHPANSRQWRTLDLSRTGNVAVWPPIGTDPNAPGFRSDYFDSLFHSAGVVGINTSAQLEAAIVGRPVFTIRAPEFSHSQDGTLHFKHLVGGAVQVAASLAGHERQVAALLVSGTYDAASARAFVSAFIRPHGLDAPAVPRFVAAIDGVLQAPAPAPVPVSPWTVLCRPPLAALAAAARELADDRPLWAHALRYEVAQGVAQAAVLYRLSTGWREPARTFVKRSRRGAWRVWYETSRELAARRRRAGQSVARNLRRVRGAARRAVRRES